MGRLAFFACGAAPFAVCALVGLLRTLQSAGAARGWVARFAGGVALLEIALGAIVGAAVVSCLAARDRRLAAATTAAGLGAGLATLLLLADGLPPLPAPGTATALALAATVGLVAAAARRLAGGNADPAAAVLVPIAAIVGAAASRFVQAALDVSPGSAAGIGAILGVVALATALAAALGRLGLRPGPAIAASLGLPALAAAAAVALGRPLDPPLPPRGDPGPPDVLLVVLDTARHDHVPASSGSAFPTPTLSRLAREGARFTSMTAPSCWTLPAHVSLFTGLSPLEHGSGWERGGLREGLPTLAERMRDAGFRTAGFSANPWVSRELGLDRGFETFVEADASRLPHPPWPVRFFPSAFASAEGALHFQDKRGRELTSELLRWLARADGRPAFAFLNLLEPHLPYAPPSRFRDALERDGWTVAELQAIPQDRLEDLRPGRRRPPREIEGLRRLYAAEIAYADSLLGRVVAALERAGRLDRTVVVVVSDHGENLGEHPPLDHQLGLWDSLVRVPAVVRYPPVLPGGSVRREPTALEDVPGWIERLASGTWEPPSRETTLAVYDRPGPILEKIRAELGIDPSPWDRRLFTLRDASRKWVFASDGRNAAFDLAADPGETRNLVRDGLVPDGFADLADALAKRLAAGPGPAGHGEAPPLDDETLRRLRSLGYVP